jgi:uncharacterized protein
MNETTEATDRIRRLLQMEKGSLPNDGGSDYNRLIFQKSPYLLQHAENPVDWYPWGEEAFAAAERKNKPIFLSIGYATCHWCHVMEEESFENPEVAEAINRLFIPIKVDREERPDIDEQYMLVAQMMTGSGGWPLNIVMTPDRRPFFAVTYLPAKPRHGMPGIVEVLENVATLWRERRDAIEKHCAAVAQELARVAARPQGGSPRTELLDAGYRQIRKIFDGEHGGFGGPPKFPMPHFLTFLFRYASRSGDPFAAGMAERTLTAMRMGGIFDQLGFGFHRYAVDREWLVPHFEKMLYDQALIAIAYLQAYRFSNDRSYLKWGEEVFRYVLNEAAWTEGGFCSGLDADSEGEEGRYYVWSRDEVIRLLGPEEGETFCRLFDVTERGNFEGKNILHLRELPPEFARREGLDQQALEADVERWRTILLMERWKRVRPLRDEKIVTGWNGLMIAAFAQGYAVTGNPEYLRAAERGAEFIEENLVLPDGRLLRSYHGGRGSVPAFLEDYAFLIWGLVELHQTTLSERFLERALRHAREMHRIFGDEAGGFFDAGSDAEEVLLRTKSAHDGVIPSGNSVAAIDLIRLGKITGDAEYLHQGESAIRAFAGELERQPANHLQFIQGVDLLLGDETVVTIAGGGEAERRGLLREVHRRFIPGLTIRSEPEGEGPAEARVCAVGACRPPVRSPEELGKLLDSLRR